MLFSQARVWGAGGDRNPFQYRVSANQSTVNEHLKVHTLSTAIAVQARVHRRHGRWGTSPTLHFRGLRIVRTVPISSESFSLKRTNRLRITENKNIMFFFQTSPPLTSIFFLQARVWGAGGDHGAGSSQGRPHPQVPLS